MNKHSRTNDDSPRKHISPRKHNRISDNLTKLPYELIKRITNNFSEERVLGHGASGVVFKGVLEDGEEVAVKMLRFMGNINDQLFENEFEILKRLEHPNIVRLVGFCNEAQEVCIEHNGKLIVCQRIHRALCLEYMPNGSLRKLLSGEIIGRNWPIRYNIIKGICEGLQYLREGLEFPIFHLDLKLENILLNEETVPKISDFGLSRLIGEENSKTTSSPLGTPGYLPPEFINHQIISKEYDIYSLGVVITKTITGISGYSDVADMGAQEFVEHVHEKWKKYLQGLPKYASLEVHCEQVKRCIEIARKCMETNRHKRPTIKDIMRQLDEMENFKLDSQPTMDKTKPDDRRPSGSYSWSPGFDWPSCREIDDDPLSDVSEETDDDSLGFLLDNDDSLGYDPRMWYIEDMNQALEKQKRGHPYKDPPSEICHPAHREHKLKLMTDAGAATMFLCDGCKEPGYGPRHARNSGGGQSLDLHTRCFRTEDPLFGLHTLVHPLFGYGKQFELRFLHEPPAPVEEGRTSRVCDACGEATRGFVYHCTEPYLDVHPCCASMPDRIIQDGRAFDLHRRASRPCALCPDDEGQRRWFWAYRCYVDDEEAAAELHVACLKETARRSWEVDYRNRPDVGGALNVDSMLDNKFGEIAGTVASFITALVFGKLNVNM